MNTPSEDLAKRILEQLLAENLITLEDAGHLLPKLAEGKMRPEDWKLALEKAIEKEDRQ